MDAITLIVTALAAGASSGAIEGLADGLKENAKAAFAKVNELARRRFRGNTGAELILSEHQADPATYEAPLVKKLTESGAADDAELLAAARELMEILDQAGTVAGKYSVTVTGSQGVQVGDGNTQVNTFSS